MIRYITDANVLKTQLFLVCFLNTTIFKSQEYTFLLDYSTHLFVKIFQRSYKMLDNWIRVFPIRDELGSNKHRFQFSPQKGNLLHLNIYVSKIFSQFKNSSPPIWDYLHPRAEVQELPQKGRSQGISGSHRDRKYRKSCERAWLGRLLAQQQPRRAG